MKSLSNNWFVEGTLDFEYKKYVLLAYLQHVSQEFAQYRLYPPLADLIAHHQTLLEVRQQKEELGKNFPRELDAEAFRQMKLSYLKQQEEVLAMEELDQIIDFSLPRIRQNLEEGIGRFEEIEQTLQIEPIGITPLYKQEGYFLLAQEPAPDLVIYQYRVIFLNDPSGKFSGITVSEIDRRTRSLVNTPEHIKLDLTRQRRELPNPATWLVRSQIRFPAAEAVIPVVKRRFLGMMGKA